ncbi:MAG TPA: S41 family peptidase [Fibrobacteria bacterium]|nr:S41 family peptidase [Fibrobacteria bacterium]
MASALAGGCIFSSPPTKGLAVPSTRTSAYDSLTDADAEVIVPLFEPYLDASLGAGGQTSLLQSLPVRVREHETGRVVEFRRSRRGYGSWSAQHERDLNLFLLRSFFFYPGAFDDTTGLATTDSLFARAHQVDPYSRYVDSAKAEEYRRQTRTSARPRVLGIQVRENDAADSLFLSLVAPGSPADKAGLRRGMPILAVNDSVITGDSAFERFARFVDADSLSAKITVGTAQGPLTKTITRDTATFPTVLADSVGGAGYVSIFSFTESTVNGGSTYSEFRAALDATRRFPATILDLRGNGGGSLPVVLRMCDEMLSGGVIIRLIERDLNGGATLRTETAYLARPGDKNEGRSWVILADGRSASASEIFISALRENLGAPFVGATTYGKGVGQASFDTYGGGVAVITYGQARAASGANYNGIGLAPTHPSSARPTAMLNEAVSVAVPGALAKRAAAGLGASDAQRAALIDWNRRQALRPDVKEWRDETSEAQGSYELRVTN